MCIRDSHGTTLINFATTYTMIGESEKALRLDMQAADIFSNVGLDTDYRLATLFNNMSFLCEDLGELDSAAEYLNRALYILNALEESQIEIAITYTNLANIYLEQDQLNEAKVTVKKALDIFIKETEGLDVHYSAAVCALGEIYYKENNYEKAVSLFEKALELTKRDYGDSTLSCAILLENIADVYKRQIPFNLNDFFNLGFHKSFLS